MLARARGVESFLLTIAIASSIIVFFLLSPIIALFLMLDPRVFRESWFTDPVLSSEAWSALFLTIQASLLSTTVLCILSIPLAYLLARKSFLGKQVVEGLIDIPLMIPHAVAGIMVLVAYGRRGVLGWLTSSLGVAVDDSFWGIVAVMMFVSAPIMVDTLKLGFKSIDESIELVARSLGGSLWTVFRRITLPLSIPSILTGYILSWARAVSEVGAILIVAYYPKTINVLVIEWFNTYGLRYAVSLSIVLVILSLIVFIATRMVFRK